MGRNRYTQQEQQFYALYLKSAEWKARKSSRIRKAGNRCEFVTTEHLPEGDVSVRCQRTRHLCVHHNTYVRLGAERDSDLDVYCWFHHMLEHLFWKKCEICKEPCLGTDTIGELWLKATLAQMGIDIDTDNIHWTNLPNKEQLAAQIHPRCIICRGFFAGDT